jgi:hypothetical protein
MGGLHAWSQAHEAPHAVPEPIRMAPVPAERPDAGELDALLRGDAGRPGAGYRAGAAERLRAAGEAGRAAVLAGP